MKRARTGEYRIISAVDEECRAYTPFPLPPNPPLEISLELQEKMLAASVALGRLDGMSHLLPDTGFFLYSYVRKEAVLSSQIEGTQSSLSDLMLFENEAFAGVPLDDVQEVSNYVLALEHGIKRLREGFPLCNRLIREIHEKLLSKGRGSERDPGHFRRSQNWIGGTRPGNALYVPPPTDEVPDCMGQLERFIHNIDGKTPALIKAALAHVQFETIHPFLDGNGRVGRLLITLILCADGILREPMLYLSLYFKTYRQRYYELLQEVRLQGDWEAWLEFFFEGIERTATEGVETANLLRQQFEKDAQSVASIGRGTGLELHRYLQTHPITSIASAVEKLNISKPTANKAMNELSKLGIIREVSGKQRGRVFVYDKYLEILNRSFE